MILGSYRGPRLRSSLRGKSFINCAPKAHVRGQLRGLLVQHVHHRWKCFDTAIYRHYVTLLWKSRLCTYYKRPYTIKKTFHTLLSQQYAFFLTVIAPLEGRAVEVGVRITEFDLLDDPPRRSGVGDVAAGTFRHSRVEDTDHTTVASEDERARVALCGEGAGLLIVVVYGQFDRLDAKFIASVGLQSGIASHRKVGGVPVLHDDETGIPITVVTVRRS